MPLAPAANMLLNCRIIYQINNQAVAMNVLHYQVTGLGGTPPDINTFNAACGSAVYNFFKTAWAAFASAEASMQSVAVTAVFPAPRSVTSFYTPATPTVGSVAGDALPAQNSVTIRKVTAVGLRSGRGRVFVAGLADANQHDGQLVAPAIADITTYGTLFGAPINVGGVGWTANLLPVLVPAPEDNPAHIYPIVSANLTDKILKSQKRRRPGKGI